ncbi:hypothetical protein NE237_020346 [Protea cynaroides]|uniref:Uncharacterized protein n=1 Tax=Protea cynaroides TaxID=273540 RepID=A0A9Q0K282_9MAGN|nr:hypothetical protein NE237_020346 [Protea cynaroides]
MADLIFSASNGGGHADIKWDHELKSTIPTAEKPLSHFLNHRGRLEGHDPNGEEATVQQLIVGESMEVKQLIRNSGETPDVLGESSPDSSNDSILRLLSLSLSLFAVGPETLRSLSGFFESSGSDISSLEGFVRNFWLDM